jgi:hypothetical protein
VIKNISPFTLLVGIGLGLAIGFFITWVAAPIILTDIPPARLKASEQQNYAIVISLDYASDHDVVKAQQRLITLGLDDPFGYLADTACTLARGSYASTTTGLVAIRAMTDLATSQQRTTCASSLIAIDPSRTPTSAIITTPPTPTPTLVQVSSKTPSPTLGPTYTPATPILPSPTVTSDFTLIGVRSFCDPKSSGVIQINIYDVDGKTGLPAVPIQVTGPTTTDKFFTGLKPEHGDGFADFRMEAGQTYTIIVAGADQKPDVEASDCTSKAGKAITSYEANYRRANKTP